MTVVAVPILRIPEPAVVTDTTAVAVVEPTADADVGISVAGMRRALAFGLTVGSVGAYLLSLAIGLAAGLDIGTAAGMSILPGIFGGLFGGGGPMLLAQMLRFEKEERRALENARHRERLPTADPPQGLMVQPRR